MDVNTPVPFHVSSDVFTFKKNCANLNETTTGHLGPCPPCLVPLTLPCRCGSSTRTISCSTISSSHSTSDSVEILCERPCPALRACGRHQCNRICCPLASLAALSKGKGGKRRVEDTVHLDEEGWHECDTHQARRRRLPMMFLVFCLVAYQRHTSGGL